MTIKRSLPRISFLTCSSVCANYWTKSIRSAKNRPTRESVCLFWLLHCDKGYNSTVVISSFSTAVILRREIKALVMRMQTNYVGINMGHNIIISEMKFSSKRQLVAFMSTCKPLVKSVDC